MAGSTTRGCAVAAWLLAFILVLVAAIALQQSLYELFDWQATLEGPGERAAVHLGVAVLALGLALLLLRLHVAPHTGQSMVDLLSRFGDAPGPPARSSVMATRTMRDAARTEERSPLLDLEGQGASHGHHGASTEPRHSLANLMTFI